MRFILLSLLLCGCSIFTKSPEPPVIISNNGKKDNYIDKVESVVSESASALTAVAPTLPEGVGRKLVEGQVIRLEGISKATVQKVKEYSDMLKKNDSKAVEADTKKAAKEEQEIDKLWAIVAEQDEKIAIEEQLRVQAEQVAIEERKSKLTYQASSASLGLLVLGILVTAFTPWKRSGMIVVAMSVISFGCLWWLIG